MLFKKFVSMSLSNIRKRLITCATNSSHEVDQQIGAWKVIRTKDVPEFSMRAIELDHTISQAKYLHLESIDNDNAFAVSFQTTPTDSTGISHILEHTVLCGSERFQVRDPFFKMLNRSLSTFMNAMTGPDYTVYPFSTQNQTDFYNLMLVYLDSVFNPLLREQDFRQEGWRLEGDNAQDVDSPLKIKGVVFNEMKGVFADSQQLFGETLTNFLLPSHSYSHCYGGRPSCIPDLSWERLCQFHSTHYCLDNARFYSCGNFSLATHIDYLDNFFSNKKLCSSLVPSSTKAVPSEQRWNIPRKYHISCAPDVSLEDKSLASNTIAFGFVACDITDKYESFVLQVLARLLFDGPNAPFYKAIIESGLARNFSPATGYDGHLKDTTFTVGFLGVADTDAVADAIRKTFVEIADKGFDALRIDAVLHQLELALKNKTTNFGLRLITSLVPHWNHSESVIHALQINDDIEQFRKDQADKGVGFLQEKIRKYFVDNSHHVVLTMSPDNEFNAKQQEELNSVEKKLIDELDEEGRKNIFDKAQDLAQRQSLKEDLSCLPTLSVSDIVMNVEKPTFYRCRLAGVPVQICYQPTNKVTYFRALLDTSTSLRLSAESQKFLPLFAHLLTQVGTSDINYQQLDTQIELASGGFSVDVHVMEDPNDSKKFTQSLLFGSHCLQKNLQSMFSLWNSILNRPTFENADRVRTLTVMLASDMMNSLSYSGHKYAMQHASGRVLESNSIRDRSSGIEFIKFLHSILPNRAKGLEDEAIQDIIQRMVQIFSELSQENTILNSNNLRIALNTSDETLSTEVISTCRSFLFGDVGASTSHPKQIFPSKDADLYAQHEKVYIETPFPVHYCAMALSTVPSFNHSDFAPLKIWAKLISSKFLHSEIREKGGAYGSGAALADSGTLLFYSYRDPRSEETLNTFKRCKQWMQSEGQISLNQQDLEEAKLGVFQQVDAPIQPGFRGQREFLTGVNDEDFKLYRIRLRDVSLEDVFRVNNDYLNMAMAPTTVIGPNLSDNCKKVMQNSSWDFIQI